MSEGLTDAPDDQVPSSQGGQRLLDLVRVQARLRAPGGCPWDAEQTHQTLARHLLEETHELLEAIDADESDEVLVNWEKLKAEEKGGAGPIEDDIPATLPALARASKVQRRAAGWGFEWRSPESALAALREEVEELAAAIEADDRANAEEEIGDVLFSVVAVARKLGVDGESALRRTIRGFAERYERFAAVASERGLDVDGMSETDVRALFREVR